MTIIIADKIECQNMYSGGKYSIIKHDLINQEKNIEDGYLYANINKYPAMKRTIKYGKYISSQALKERQLNKKSDSCVSMEMPKYIELM